MSTLSDLHNLQAAYQLKEALVETDDRLYGNQRGGSGGVHGGSRIGDARMLPVVTPNGRNFLRDTNKGMRLLIDRDQVQPGNILEYTSDTGETHYAQVSNVGEVDIGQDGITVKEVDSTFAASYISEHPDKHVTLTQENLRPELVYKHGPLGFWDRVFAPIDWLVLKTRNSPLNHFFNTVSKRSNKDVWIVVGVVMVLLYMAITFYLVVK